MERPTSQKTPATFDVVVPCYRYGHFLNQCVHSVLDQEGVIVRVLVIDDASPDNSAAVARGLAEADSRVTVIEHRQNKGHIATYNEGLAQARGDFVVLLSADDYLLPGALQRAAGLMGAHPQAGLLFGNAFAHFDDGAMEAMNSMPHLQEDTTLSSADFLAACCGRNVVTTPTAVVRTALQHEVGYYDPTLPHSGDMEMWLRLAARGSVGFIHAPQAVYRRHRQNMSLAYDDTMLPDILQREAAIRAFIVRSDGWLADSADMQAKMLAALAREAARCASAAFNRADAPLGRQLAMTARRLSPQVVSTREWKRLALKRSVGPVWPAIHRLRQLLPLR